MRLALATNWWSLVLRGALGIFLGIVTFVWPGITLAALVFVFGAYALIDGVVCIVGAVRAVAAHDRWGALLLEGIAGIVAALITVIWPPATLLALIYVIAAWSIATGVFELVAAIRLRKYISHEWLLVLGAIASIVFGILVAAAPLAGAFVLALWVGAYALVFGVLLVALGFRLRSWDRGLHAGPSAAVPAH